MLSRNSIPKIPSLWVLLAGVVLLALVQHQAIALGRKTEPWHLKFPRSKTIVVSEKDGLARNMWPVVATVQFDENELEDMDTQLVLACVEKGRLNPAVIPFQILDDHSEKGQIGLCFFTDIEPHGKSEYVLYHGNSGIAVPKVESSIPLLKVSGDGLGLIVDTGPVIFHLDPASGQLLNYTPKLVNYDGRCGFERMGRKQAMHYNPDVYAPPKAWGHVSDWGLGEEAAPDIISSRGPLYLRTIRTGDMPRCEGVEASVSYTFFAGMPFVLETSRVEFKESLKLYAVRSNELVFSRGIHTMAFWLGEGEEVVTRRCYDPNDRTKFFGNISGKLDPDIPSLGFYHERHRYGICFVNFSHNSQTGTKEFDPEPDAHYYISDPNIHGTAPDTIGMNFTYLCRPYIYRHMTVPKGTVYAESSAILVFEVGKEDNLKKFDSMKSWAEMLRHPVEIDVK